MSFTVMRREDAMVVHRFLAVCRDGRLLTKGDHLRRPDTPWSRESLVGRVVAHSRQGRSLPVLSPSFSERFRARWHRVLFRLRTVLRRLKWLLPLLLLFVCALPTAAWAEVTLLSFAATPVEETVLVTWETASEINMLGFYVWRSSTEIDYFERISALILAMGDPLTGDSYEYIDSIVVAGTTYLYQLEMEEIGGVSTFHGPVTVTLPILPTATPTWTPSPTPTFTPIFSPSPPPGLTPSPAPTNTPSPEPTFSPEPSLTAWPAATFTPPSVPTLSSGPSPTPSFTPRPTATMLEAATVASSTPYGISAKALSAYVTATVVDSPWPDEPAGLASIEQAAVDQAVIETLTAAVLVPGQEAGAQVPTSLQNSQNRVVINLLVAAGLVLVVLIPMFVWAVIVHRRLF